MESAATDVKRWVLFLHEGPPGNTDNVEEDVVAETGTAISEEDGEDEAADAEGVTLPEFLEREQREEEVLLLNSNIRADSKTQVDCAGPEQASFARFFHE